MLDSRTNLDVHIDNNSVFTNITNKAASFGRDIVETTLSNATDYLYIGYRKPINAIYIDITVPNGLEGSMSFEYFNGTSFVASTSILDDTQGLFRSGFIRWDRELTDQEESEINSVTKYWYRIKASVDRTLIKIGGINIIFSDDYELSLEQPYISNSEFLGDEASHIKTHFAVKREIIQNFKGKNYIKERNGIKYDINAWDLHDIDEVKIAATHLALSKIYFQLSDNEEDVWRYKSVVHGDKYIKFINLARVSLDEDDDGVQDEVENKPRVRTLTMSR